MTTSRAFAVLAGLVLLTSACEGKESYSSSTPKEAGQQRINDGGTADARTSSTVQVSATNFRFSPSTILATPGEKVTLVVHNTSQTPHNVTATGVDEDLSPGAIQTVTLTVPVSGELVFVCEYHKASGMAGRLGPTAGSPAASSRGGAGSTYGGGY